VKEVKKVWGKELWVVNEEYCGKLLYVDAGSRSSYHYHLKKKETFHCIEGDVMLNIKGTEFLLEEPVTINPNTPHSFYGITDAIILEVSSHHEDSDVVRINESSRMEVKV